VTTIAEAALEAYCKDLDAKRNAALELAVRFGGIAGSHHKTWVIDQMCRALLAESYPQFVLKVSTGDEGIDTYEWQTGIAP